MDILQFLEHLNSLKHLKRTGWVHFKVPEPETVASHQYRMAMLAMTLDNTKLNTTHCMKMALVHDIGEAIVGDLTPRCGVSDVEKFELENDAVKKISELVPQLNGEIYSLWKEYEEFKTPEAIAVKQLDKIDMIAQALSYEAKYKIDLGDFFKSTVNSFTTEPFIEWNRKIREKREELWSKGE